MKNRKILIAVLLIVMTCCIFVLAGCKSDNYDTKGTAKVNIILDKEYVGLEVSCTEGVVKKSDSTHYSVTFTNRKLAKILLTCAGYTSKTLTYTTKQLATEINDNVSLEPRKYEFSTSVAGVEKLDAVRIVDKSDGAVEGNIESVKVENSKIIVTSKMPLTKISVESEGYKPLGFDLPAYNSKYKVETKLMLMAAQNNSQVCVIVVNDGKVNDIHFDDDVYRDNIASISMRGYGNQGEDILFSSGFAVMGKEKNYKVSSSGGNNGGKDFVLSAKELQNTDGYYILNSSKLTGGDKEVVPTTQWNIENGITIFNNNIPIYAKTGSYKVERVNKENIKYIANLPSTLVAGDKLLYDDKYGNYNKLVHVLSDADILAKTVDLLKFVEINASDLDAKMKFVDEDGKLITEEITIKDQMLNGSLSMTTTNGTFVAKGSDWKNIRMEIVVGDAAVFNERTLTFNDISSFIEEQTYVLKKKATVKLKLAYGDGLYLQKLKEKYIDNKIDDADENGYFKFDKNIEDGSELINFGNYEKINGLRLDFLEIKFDKKLASYNATENVYYMEVLLQQEYIVEFTIANYDSVESQLSMLIEKGESVFLTINNSSLYYYDDPIYENRIEKDYGIKKVFKLKIYESMIGKTLTYSCSRYDENMSVEARGLWKINLDDLKKGSAQFDISVEIRNSNK